MLADGSRISYAKLLLATGSAAARAAGVELTVAFWLGGGRVLAGMNVNIWDVNEAIQAFVRGGRTVDTDRLADPNVPLDEFAWGEGDSSVGKAGTARVPGTAAAPLSAPPARC
jgi:hypothetical protein